MSSEQDPATPDGDIVLELDPLEGINRYTEPERYEAARKKADEKQRKFYERLDRLRRKP